MIKKLQLLFISLLMSFSMTLSADTLDTILERGTLKVGVSLFEPWTMQDKDGMLSGYEIDVAKNIANDLGVDAEFVVYNWEDIIPALQQGEIDLIAGGMAITPQRALKVSFSQPYAHSGISLATNIKLTQHVETLEQLNHKDINIAVISKTASNDIAERMFENAQVTTFSTVDQATQAVLTGKAHAYIGSSPQPEFFSLRNADVIDIPLSKPLMSYKAAFGVNKGEQELLNFLNAWIIARTEDQWLPTIHKHWFRSLDWQEESE